MSLRLIALFCLAQVHAQEEATHSLTLDSRLLNLPVCKDAPKQLVKLEVGGKKVREFEIEFTSEKKPDFYVFLEVNAWKGQATILRGPSAVIEVIESGDEIKTSVPVYAEPWRPQYHFMSMRGRMNDPNGLLIAWS